jgi:hypothetical protein
MNPSDYNLTVNGVGIAIELTWLMVVLVILSAEAIMVNVTALRKWFRKER